MKNRKYLFTDALEVTEAWKVALERNGPTALIFTRQNVPVLDRSVLAPAEGLKRGGYILWAAGANPDIILIATGSEVHLSLEAGRILQKKGVNARVVSLPTWELFEKQPDAYRNSIIPAGVRARISVEAATPMSWERFVGLDGVAIGVNGFGSSAPGEVLYEKYGITTVNIVDTALKLLHRLK